MTIQTIADIAGDNAVHAFATGTNPIGARRVWVTAHGSSNARIGDLANVGSARGAELTADVTVLLSANDADPMDRIQLEQLAAYVPTGTTLTVTFGV